MSDETKEEHPLEGRMVMVPKAGPQMVFIGAESAASLLAALDASARERRLWEEEEVKRYTERQEKADKAQADHTGYLRAMLSLQTRQTFALEGIAAAAQSINLKTPRPGKHKTPRKGAKKRKAVRK